jgi:alpha-L-rhamnosidase
MKHCRKFTYGRFQTGEMILDGGEINTYEPKFTYYAFRYVQVSGLTEKPRLEDILAKRVHADIQEAGSFSSSNDLINKAQEVMLRTTENYIHHHPADPVREKLGWTQDAQTMADMSMYNFQMAKLYKKWIQDFYDAQEESGHVLPIAPTGGWGGWQPDGKPGKCSDPWWGGAAVYLPWDCYRFYGDVRFLKDGYENMKRYVDFLGTTADDNILDWQLGDWLEVGAKNKAVRTPVEQTSTSAYYYLASLLEKIAGILNNAEDVKIYHQLKENIGESFNRHFLDKQTGIYADDSQTSQILPLTLGIVPEAQKDLTLQALIENINKRDKHLSVGFVGLVPLMHGLDDLGEAELSYKIAAQEDFPGWLLMVKETGSFWESWDAFESYRGQCFISLGGPLGSWMYRTLGGIRPDEHLPGFKHIIIKPAIVNELEWVKSNHQSPYGEIVSNWETKDGKLTMDITIPPNTTSSIYIPAKDSDSITESGIEIENSTSFKWKRFNDEKVLVKVGSGKYHFEVVKI